MKSAELENIDEVEILTEAPKKVKIGNRFVLIRQLTIREYFWIIKSVMKLYLKYSDELIKIYNIYRETVEEKNKFKQTAEYMVTLIKIEAFRKETFKMLNKLFPVVGRRLPFRMSYLERHATPNDILQIIFGLYQYNIADVKKNLETMLTSMNLKETVVSSNLKSSSKETITGQRARPSTLPSEKLNDIPEKKTTEINLG